MALYKTSTSVGGLDVWLDAECQERADDIATLIGVSVATYSEPKTEPACPIEVPPGWELLTDAEASPCDYWYNSICNRWIRTSVLDPRHGPICYKYVIRQSINIDMDRHPKELVAWAMDNDGEWFAFQDFPKIQMGCWNGVWRRLFKSEFPTNFTGNWKDSLIVRPEFWNKHKGYTE